jgi:UDPglucose 6-dehydrogenase
LEAHLQVAILGCGHVGLVTAACLSELGHSVICGDRDETKIRALDQGILPFYEPGLQEAVVRCKTAGRLSFTADLGEVVCRGDVIFICIGTPPLRNGDADLSSIDAAARLIATEANDSKLVVEKSTVPMQTGQKLARALAIYARNSNHSFSVASNPEFLREGTALLDFLHPDRIIIGVSDSASETRLREIYQPILRQRLSACPVHNGSCPLREPPPLLVTSINSAELIKHASNSFLAMKISYANLLADICESMGADVEEVIHGMGLDHRIGTSCLQPGLGFGGFCLPKDIQAFVRLGEKGGIDVSLLRSADSINKNRIDQFVRKAISSLWTLKDKRIGILGLAFKPNTDDVRFAPALELISRLHQEGADLGAYDPEAMNNAAAVCPSIEYCADPYQVAHRAEAIMVVTEWECFRELDWLRMKNLMQRPVILDGRNLLDRDLLRKIGFEYHGIGIPSVELPAAHATGPDSILAGRGFSTYHKDQRSLR